ncbi:glycosyltransferase [Mobilicoccus pelagius]|uniref:4,4'-diaponeurosporenoate glycosyltransferase n=1 Tax=Mobilicoccus pelagius NBRC 104925 TaxID=1089455 RepID=H5UMR5_9MICO|nr:glycosyltransferase [Mobilicoccus pelagius]GAB47023.1 hypothetical protein MOPEL_003_00460 [Mobilicoccus pelagius NBRC 104925]
MKQFCDASVVVPAYNEERVIAACLESLAPYTQEGSHPRLEVVVAANGCHDRTVEIAREYDVEVLDIPTGSKSLALNAGDAAATALPRIYLDADIVLSNEAIPALVEALSGPEPLVAAPHVQFDLRGASWPVRAYYRVFREIPYVTDGLVGLGVYAVSAAGRARFDRFPDVHADDLFIQRLFAPHERLTTAGTFTVTTPRTLRSLIDVRVRVARGNTTLADTDADRFAATTGSTGRALLDLLRRRPTELPSVLVFLAVTLTARRRAARPAREAAAWERDESSRLTPRRKDPSS